MNRNTQEHFAHIPKVHTKRSIFDKSHTHKTTLDAGKLYPIFMDEVLPGDTFKTRTAAVIRMTTPIFPVMDECFADIYFFYIPNRILWKDWKAFMGENTVSPWYNPNFIYTLPVINPAETDDTYTIHENSLMAYFGLPINTTIGKLSQNATPISNLPIRAYYETWNEWFRDQNFQAPINVIKDETNLAADYITMPSTIDGQIGKPWENNSVLPVNKFHDLFTSVLPNTQKGQPLRLPWEPLRTGAQAVPGIPVRTWAGNVYGGRPGGPYAPLTWSAANTGNPFITTSGQMVGLSTGDLTSETPLSGGNRTRIGGTPETAQGSVATLPNNLYVNIREEQGFPSINALRMAFQTQRLLEKDARGGTRYVEMINTHFGVTSPDARQQRPEYLGGKRIQINIQQVVQTSSTDTTSPQGNTAAYSLTGIRGANCCNKSFTEHGIIIGLVAIRQKHTYQNQINKKWTRQTRLDYYFPVLANIGEQAVKNSELKYSGTPNNDNESFGFQEAWYEYRYMPDLVTGKFNSNASTPLDTWHYADNFANQPTATQEFFFETKENIQRTLAVENQPQFIADFYFENIVTRPMPVYSVPGLIDHN